MVNPRTAAIAAGAHTMKNAILILGEAYGETEERQKRPFVGTTGYELTRLLNEAGIRRADCYLTNVFNLRPPGNKIEEFCGPKAQAIPLYPALVRSMYVRKEFESELDRLKEELDNIDPNVVVAMGNTACWALLGKTTISSLRGVTAISTHTLTGFKVLPTYHPAAIFRNYPIRPIVVMDLVKAKRESEHSTIKRPKREVWIDPTIEDIERFRDDYIQGCNLLSVDIETSGNQVTMLGLAPSRSRSLVIPFSRAGRNYWPTPALERKAWQISKDILADPGIPKVFQNGLYDIAFLWRSAGLAVYGAEHDTMLLHHALQPESIKDLGFLGSVYTDEGAWKRMRGKRTTIKRDD